MNQSHSNNPTRPTDSRPHPREVLNRTLDAAMRDTLNIELTPDDYEGVSVHLENTGFVVTEELLVRQAEEEPWNSDR